MIKDNGVKHSVVGSGTVERTVALLTLMAELPGDATIQALASAMGLAPSTIHRLLDLLIQAGFVERDEVLRRYHIGPSFFRVASLALEKFSLKEQAVAAMQRVVDTFGETAILGLYGPSDQTMFFASVLQSRNALGYQVDIGTRHPLIWGGSSKAILAFLSDSEIKDIHAVAKAAPATGTPVPSLTKLMTEVKHIREQGYAYSRGEKMAGACAIAAPIFGIQRIVGCLVVTIPEFRISATLVQAIAPMLKHEAQQLSALQGFKRE